MADLLQTTERGLYCPAGDFYVDPWRPVPKAVVTHAHSDHARWGCDRYLAAASGERLLRMRLGDSNFQFVAYNEPVVIDGIRVTLHPAGHMLGSSQVRIEHRGQVAVVTGDYKLGVEDSTCAAWEPVRCDLLVTESTFGLPVYRWPTQSEVMTDLHRWWRGNQDSQKCSVLYGYAIGKSQRLLAALDASVGPIYTHGAVEKGVQAYRDSGVTLPPTIPVSTIDRSSGHAFHDGIVLAVPSVHGTSWLRRFGPISTAMASGWMAIRGPRRRRAVDRGFVLSDHVDWTGLLSAVAACEPQRVWVTHGYTAVAARYLAEQGYETATIATQFRGEVDDSDDATSETAAS